MGSNPAGGRAAELGAGGLALGRSRRPGGGPVGKTRLVTNMTRGGRAGRRVTRPCKQSAGRPSSLASGQAVFAGGGGCGQQGLSDTGV